jgi:hypothetical protein
MSRGCRQKSAGWVFASAIGLISGGCHWLPPNRMNPALDPRSLGTTTVTTGSSAERPDALASRESVPRPALPLRPISDEEALGTTRPTPILDAALVRAQAIEEAAFSPEEAPKSEPADARPAPAPTRLEPTPSTPEPDTKPESPPESAPPANPKAAAEPAPEVAWSEGIDKLRGVARTLQGAPGQPAAIWELRGRLLDWLAEPAPDEARAEGDSLWPRVLSLLATASEADPRAAASALEARAPLEVAELRLCRKVSGFGSFDPIEERGCQAGAVLLLYCEMAGLRYEPRGDRMQSRLESHLEILPEKDEKPLWKQDLGIAEDTCRRARRDYYVNYRITLPGPDLLPPGSYRLRVTQKDLLAGHQADHAIPLTIVGEAQPGH